MFCNKIKVRSVKNITNLRSIDRKSNRSGRNYRSESFSPKQPPSDTN